MAESESVDRRRLLKGSLLLGALGASPPVFAAKTADGAPPSVDASAPTEARAQAEAGRLDLVADESPQIADPGSDLMVELLRLVGIDYVATMPGSSFRGLHESIVNFGGNNRPELISCTHEEISAAMAHGYAKAAGKPMACLVHSNVGLQHATMAIYNAWCDRAPMLVLAGNSLDAANRRPWIEWLHAQTDLATLVRDFTKWDDTPISIQAYAESFMRAYELMLTPPYEPVLLVVDSDLQEEPIHDRAALRVPKRSPVAPPAGDQAAIDQVASLLINANAPLIIADRVARTPRGLTLMTELAELVMAPVVDKFGRLNMPTDHFLNHSFRQHVLLPGADLIVGLEVTDLYGQLNSVPDLPVRKPRALQQSSAKVVAISANYGYMKGNVQDIQRYVATDLAIAADAEAALPQLIASVRRQLTPERRQVLAAREDSLRTAFDEMRAMAAEEAASSWNISPISTGRLCMELWEQIKDLDWALVSGGGYACWPQRLWNIREHHQFIGSDGGYGVGYTAPASAGAALAHRDKGRLPIAIQSDGDLMVLPGTLWTLAHHRIPLLMIMQNNRAWHQEVMHLQRMSSRRNRGVDRAGIGTTITDPNIDFSQLARSMGVWAEGPVTDPGALKPAIARALAIVQGGKPALIDVVTQPR